MKESPAPAAAFPVGDWCYAILFQDPTKHGGFVPSLVTRTEARAMTGSDPLQAPWIWGTTMDQAEATCITVNARNGISVVAAANIVQAYLSRN